MASLLLPMTANATIVNHTDCNYDYKKIGFDKFNSVLDSNASGVELLKEERVFHAQGDDSKDVSVDHKVRVKNGTSFAHRILCYGDLISSFVSVYDMKNYRTDVGIEEIMKQVERIVANMPLKKDSDFREKWKDIRRYAIKDAVTKNAKFYEMDNKTGKYVELPKECRFISDKNPECPVADDIKGYVQLSKEFFNVHIKIMEP